MRNNNSSIKFALLLSSVLLAACHHGSDSPTPSSPPPTYTVGGTVSGSTGAVTLANNGGDNKVVSAAGSFAFATALANGAAYSVTVVSKPSDQTCTVTNGSGTIAAGNVTNVSVTCVTITYTVGGSVTGLSGSGLVLQNNGADNLARTADGAFTFATAINSGSAYNVTVLTQPVTPAQTCTPTNGSGNIAANVSNVTITCVTNLPAGVANIGPAGGIVNGYYGARIVVPAGALAGTVGIGLARDSSNSPAFAVTAVDAVGATYELTPHGTAFAAPVSLHIPFDPTQLPDDAVPVLYKAETGGTFTALPTTINGNFLDATVTNFSWVIPGYVATKPRAVYVIQAAGNLASYRINTTTGALTGPTSTAVTGATPTSVVAHPSRRFVYVTNAGTNTVNGIAPQSISVHQLNTLNGTIVGAATSTVTTGATVGQLPTMPVIHPSGKFLYVMNFGSVTSNAGGDISLFSIDGTTGALTLSNTPISGGGAQPMGIGFNPLGTFAFVLYEGSSSSNTFSSQVKVYSVDATTGILTGPLSGAAACGLGNHPWSIVTEANGKFAYVACLGNGSDIVITYSINSTTGALTNVGTTAVTAGSKLASLATDSFGRFLYAGRQQPWLNTNLLSYQINSTSGALSLANSVLTACPGGGCVGPMTVVAEPQGQFVYAIDVQQGLTAFAADQTTGALTIANSLTGISATGAGSGGLGMPFTFGVTGTHPLWQNNCTYGCAMWHSGGGGSGPIVNPTPPTAHYLTVTQGAFFGGVSSSPAGINYGPSLQTNNFSASFPVGTNVQLCTTPPPQPSQAYDVTWTGSCSGTGICSSVTITSDKQCHVEFTPITTR